jgi:hypothetical protein
VYSCLILRAARAGVEGWAKWKSKSEFKYIYGIKSNPIQPNPHQERESNAPVRRTPNSIQISSCTQHCIRVHVHVLLHPHHIPTLWRHKPFISHY